MRYLLLLVFLLTAGMPAAIHAQQKQKQTKRQARKEASVYICNSKSAYAYHADAYCRGLNRCRHGISKVSASDAVNNGYRACKICY